MPHRRTTWMIFAGAMLAAAAIVGWLTMGVLRADRLTQQLQQQALFESKVRVALWRLDSVAAPLLALESSRSSYLPAAAIENSPRLTCRLLKGSAERRRDGRWVVKSDETSEAKSVAAIQQTIAQTEWWSGLLDPLDVPTTDDRAAAVSIVGNDSPGPWQASDDELVVASVLAELIEWPSQSQVQDAVVMNPANEFQQGATQNSMSQPRGQSQLPQTDVASRQQFVNNVRQLAAGAINQSLQAMSNPNPKLAKPDGLLIGTHSMVWVGDELLMARKIRWKNSDTFAIECRILNWPEWQRVLASQIRSLFPDARLVPSTTSPRTDASHWQMVSLPVALELNSVDVSVDWPRSLIVAWLMLALAAVAVGWLLWQTQSLSERRAAFVSAVTHELRTPLTTFRLYTEMLSDGLVADPEQQQTYFRTLAREANRLTHLVENVLSFARLERGRSTSRNESLTVGALCDRCTPRLAQRVAETPLQWTVDMADDVHAVPLVTNVTAIEQVLFNLVDNACKYAIEARDTRLVFGVRRERERVVISLRDFGPGLSMAAKKTLFAAFEKSSSQAAETAPGIGLGLSLSRRLARDLGGDLVCVDQSSPGVLFELRLPL